jgi:hypothetical protein
MSTLLHLDFKEMFTFSDPLATRPLRLTTEGYSDWLTWKQAVGLFRGELSLSQPLKLHGYMGRQMTDVLWSAFTPIIVISQRLLDILKEHQLSGWKTYSVEVYGREDKLLPNYYGLSITGRAGDRDRTRSLTVTKPAPVPNGKPRQVYKGLYFDERQWDKSDFFLVSGRVIVTKTVKETFKKAKISNVHFVPLPEVEIDVFLDRFEESSP